MNLTDDVPLPESVECRKGWKLGQNKGSKFTNSSVSEGLI